MTKTPEQIAAIPIMRFFEFGHLPNGPGREASAFIKGVATEMVHRLPEGPELSAGLRKLLEAKDCFVRAALAVPSVEEQVTGRSDLPSTTNA